MWKSARGPFEACGLGSVGCGGKRLGPHHSVLAHATGVPDRADSTVCAA